MPRCSPSTCASPPARWSRPGTSSRTSATGRACRRPSCWACCAARRRCPPAAPSEMERLKRAFAEDPAARAALASDGDPAAGARAPARARRRGGRGGLRATSTWSATASSTASTSPSPRRSRCRTRSSGPSASPSPERRRPPRTSSARIAEVRAQVPAAHQAEFDELLGEARLTYRLRDERGVYSDIWASGLMRRAALAAGPAGRGPRPHRHARAHAGREPRRDVRAGRRRRRPVRGRARRARRVPRDLHRQGRAAAPRPARAAPARPRGPAARGRPPHARDLHRPGPSLRKLRGAARGDGPLRARGEQGRLRGAGAPRLRPLRVRPDRQGRRARHRVDDRGLQHPPAAARRHRHRQRRPALARGDRRRASTASPASSAPARRPSASPTACASASTAMPARSRCSDEEGRPLREGARDRALRVEGRGARRRRAPGPAGPARRGALGRPGRGRRLRARTRPSRRWRRRSPACGRRSPSARPPSTRTARRRASPASTSPCSTSIRRPTCPAPSARSGGPRTRTRPSPTASASACSRGRASASSSRRCSTPTVAGVMFTENPVTGADERLIEASWGLGEAVVAGLVVPDHFRLDRSGQVLERKAGRKRIAIRSLPNGRHLRGAGAARAGEPALPRRRPARGPGRAGALRARRSTARAATSSGRSRTGRSTSSSAAPSPPGRRAATPRRPARRRATPWPPSSASSSSPTWTGGRPSRSPACSRSAASRRARP